MDSTTDGPLREDGDRHGHRHHGHHHWWEHRSLPQPLCYTDVDGERRPRYCDFQYAACRLDSAYPDELVSSVAVPLLSSPMCKVVSASVSGNIPRG